MCIPTLYSYDTHGWVSTQWLHPSLLPCPLRTELGPGEPNGLQQIQYSAVKLGSAHVGHSHDTIKTHSHDWPSWCYSYDLEIWYHFLAYSDSRTGTATDFKKLTTQIHDDVTWSNNGELSKHKNIQNHQLLKQQNSQMSKFLKILKFRYIQVSVHLSSLLETEISSHLSLQIESFRPTTLVYLTKWWETKKEVFVDGICTLPYKKVVLMFCVYRKYGMRLIW